MIQGTEPDLTSSSERMQDDPVTALQQARALVAASVCGYFPSLMRD